MKNALSLLVVILALLPGLAVAQPPLPPQGDWPGPYVSQGGPPAGPPGAPGEGPGGPEGPGRGPQGPVTPEMETRFLAFMKQNDPDSVEELTRLKTQDARQYQRVVAEGVQRMRFLETMKQRDQASYEGLMKEFRLDASSRRLVREYREAADGRKAALRKQLATVLDQLFDLREANRKRQIEHLEKQLAELKATTQSRSKNKASIVQRRLEELLGDPATSW